jgi:hypothetical protein
MINPRITEILREFGIGEADGLVYLFSLYYGKIPSYIPQNIKARVNSTGIVTHDTHGGVKWTVPLFEGQETHFEWVKSEYLGLFKHYKKHNKFKRECVLRMKKIFAENPEIRKQDVLGGTSLYIKDCIRKGTSAQFVKSPHYFIEQRKGRN